MRTPRDTSLLTSLLRQRRKLGLLALLAFLPLAISCYGRFPLTHAVYRLNGDVSGDKWIRSIVFWIFVIIPVYGVAFFVDAIGCNLIQFWTGETIDVSSAIDKDGNTVTLAPSADGSEARLTVTREGRILQEARFVKQTDGNWTILDAAGQRQGTVVVNGKNGIEMLDTDGKVMRSISSETVLKAKQKAA